MARPTKAPQDKRTRQINVALSPLELARVQDRAEKMETNITAFVRAAALDKPLAVQQTTAPDFMTRHELRRIGVNLNQIAHTLNAGLGYVPAELSDVCAKLDRVFDLWLAHDTPHQQNRPQL